MLTYKQRQAALILERMATEMLAKGDAARRHKAAQQARHHKPASHKQSPSKKTSRSFGITAIRGPQVACDCDVLPWEPCKHTVDYADVATQLRPPQIPSPYDDQQSLFADEEEENRRGPVSLKRR